MNVKVRRFALALTSIAIGGALLVWIMSKSEPERLRDPAPPLESIVLEAAEIEKLSAEALSGSGEAARRLSIHFSIGRGNVDEALYWSLIAAENGDIVGQYNAGVHLRDHPDTRNKARARYWFRVAADRGDKEAKEQLKELDQAADSAGKTDSETRRK